MNGFLTILKKELIDAARDRRAISAAMLPALLGPLAMMLMLSTAAESRRSGPEAVHLPVIGAEHAPDLIDYLEQHDIVIEPFDGDPRTEIKARNVNAVLEIPADYGEKFQAFERATIELYADHSLEKSGNAADRVRDLIGDYSRSIGRLRLMIRGVNPMIVSPIDLQHRDYSTRTSRAAIILGTLQLILLMAAFFGGAGVAIDTTAGERERASWVPLLVHPLSSFQIVGGKWMAVATFAFIACAISVISTAAALRIFSLEALGADPRLTLPMMASILALQIPLVLFASAIQMLVTLFAKTFKEAQAYLGLLTLLPMIPVMINLFKQIKTETWMYLIPIAGQQQLMTTVMRGEGMAWDGYGLTALVTLALSALMVQMLVRLVRSPRVVFGT